ncbi:MAG TPA: YfhO family protein [Chloroflexota bacterium]|nr:YfhO family protein [Chloroflexota bacterium]
MHVALKAPDPARPEREASASQAPAGGRWPRPGATALWVGGLLIVICLSMADALFGDVVAYERDTTVFYYPLMTWVAERLRAGELPLWTPQVFGGYPIFADGEIGLAYPPALLALLLLPADRAFIVLRLVHLAIAALGTFAFARAWRLPYASAALAGVVFALGNFLSAQIHHENIIRTASWLPVMLALVERALLSTDGRRRLRWMALAAGALGLAGLSLHSQMLAIDLLILAGYGAFRWAVGPLGSGTDSNSNSARAEKPWLRRFGIVALVCGPVVVLGIGLAAVQLLPLIELAGFSPRGSGIPYSESAAYSLTPYGLAQLIFPYVFRGPSNVQWGLWTHWESYLYIGLAPLVLAIVALVCVRRREVVGWAIIAAIGVLLALGQYSPINLHYLLWLVPGLSGLRAPGRFTLVVILAAGMLAAYGLAWLQGLAADRSPTDRRKVRRLVGRLAVGLGSLGVLVSVAHLALLTWPAAAGEGITAAYLVLSRDTYPLTVAGVLDGLLWSTDMGNPRVSGALLGLAVILGALWAWHVGPSERLRAWRGWPAVLVGLAAADLLIFTWSIHPRESLRTLGSEPPSVAVVDHLPTPDAAPSRLLASPVLNQVSADRLAPIGSVQEANGYSSLQFIWHRDYLGRVLYVDDGLLDLWNVRYVLDPASYGTLSGYKGVTYLPQQVLLHAPAGGALAEQQFSLAPNAPISELRFVTALMGAVDVVQGTPAAQVELRDAAGVLVGNAELLAGRDTMDWAWDLPSVQPVVRHQRVESAGTTTEGSGSSSSQRERQLSFTDLAFDRPISATTLTIRSVLPTGELAVYGGAIVGPDGTAQQLFGRTKTKYRQVYVDKDIRVLENLSARPRAFVVPDARVAASLGTALNEMVHTPFQPDQEVVLADDVRMQATPLVTNRGGQGSARVTAYGADAVAIHTISSGEAWLVLSDTYYPGWTATIDGQPTPVLRGDVLFRVVAIPGGEHDVVFRFEPASVKLGLPISLGAALVVLVGLAIAGGLTRRRRTTSS